MELNTIASSFGCLSTLVARMHRYLLGRLGASPAELAALPEHNAMDAIVDAMGAAVADYGTPGVEQAGEGGSRWLWRGVQQVFGDLHAESRWHPNPDMRSAHLNLPSTHPASCLQAA